MPKHYQHTKDNPDAKQCVECKAWHMPDELNSIGMCDACAQWEFDFNKELDEQTDLYGINDKD